MSHVRGWFAVTAAIVSGVSFLVIICVFLYHGTTRVYLVR